MRGATRAPEVKLLNPRFEEEFAAGKDFDPDRERAAAKQLRRQLQKERRGAMRELRKDAAFLGQVRAIIWLTHNSTMLNIECLVLRAVKDFDPDLKSAAAKQLRRQLLKECRDAMHALRKDVPFLGQLRFLSTLLIAFSFQVCELSSNSQRGLAAVAEENFNDEALPEQVRDRDKAAEKTERRAGMRANMAFLQQQEADFKSGGQGGMGKSGGKRKR